MEFALVIFRPFSALVQDSVLAIGSASTAVSFRDTVLNALHLILFQVVS